METRATAAQIDAWRWRQIEGEHAYVYLDGIWLKHSWGGKVKNVSILVEVSVNAEVYREALGMSRRLKTVWWRAV